jgi:hypothetical protein
MVAQTSLPDLAAPVIAGVLAVCSAARSHRQALVARRRSPGR